MTYEDFQQGQPEENLSTILTHGQFAKKTLPRKHPHETPMNKGLEELDRENDQVISEARGV